MFPSRRSTGSFLARLSGAAAVAIAAALTLSQSVLADNVTGQTGDYLFTDSSGTPGATCKYTASSSDPNSYWISSITAVPPSLWWPDQNSSTNTEHGRVGWRFLVRYSTGAGYSRAAKSPIQKKIAYEDSQNPYGNSTKAPLTKQTVSFNGKAHGISSTWKITVNAFWYKPSGAVMGTASHVVLNYLMKLANRGTFMSANPYCPAQIQIV